MKQTNTKSTTTQLNMSAQVIGKPLNVGTGFQALSFKHDQFNGLMDPLVMVDHYTMTQPTFGEHPHAGMSAVSILFEDSEGIFNNQDSLGNNIDLLPGDAYWLKAGAGAIHDEKPTLGSRTHGLQIFVNLPKACKHDTPDSLHVPANNMPIIKGNGFRVRVIFGNSNGITGAPSPAQTFTALDAYLENDASYTHELKGEQSALIYVISGSINVHAGNQNVNIANGQSMTIQTQSDKHQLHFESTNEAHFVVLQGAPIQEPFAQKGPFVMSDLQELERVSAAYEAGLFGSISSDFN
ncbi:pirin-like C-terminal cupin domain-containing protein [Arenicella sp. 4NH20-0111]|uniref:pirin family protein n=1 Tax=Arenicella sp. 4NH20-0111 TaxID=3127648 RepID=UPI003340D9EA